MLLLNYLSDYYGVLWRYDGYNSRAGMHVLNCVRPEERQYFAIDHTSGVSTELFCSYTPVCCGKSDLFLTCYEEPYAWEKPVNVVYIYKVLPGGKIAQVASCDRGPVSERLIWTILYGSANIRSLLRRYPGRSPSSSISGNRTAISWKGTSVKKMMTGFPTQKSTCVSRSTRRLWKKRLRCRR